MKWIRERDTLIAQTMAFVQTMTGKNEEAGKPPARLEAGKPDLEVASLDAIKDALNLVDLPKETFTQSHKDALKDTLQSAPPKRVQTARPIVPSELQNEIKSRIESFRAHQERFNRERAEYFNTTLARLRASLDEAAAQRIGK
jgi:hypothetical protein